MSIEPLVQRTHVLEIVGDMLKVRGAAGVALGDLAIVENVDGETSTAEVVGLDQDIVSLQIYAGGKGQSTDARVRFLGHGKRVTYSNNILGRVFNGAGEPIDGKPELDGEPQIDTGGPTVNPMMRVLASKMIETEHPDDRHLQLPGGEPEDPDLLGGRRAVQSACSRASASRPNADVVVFGGMGLIFDDYHFFKTAFEDHGVFHRTVMFVNQASDPIVERLLVPDMACSRSPRSFAVEQRASGCSCC